MKVETLHKSAEFDVPMTLAHIVSGSVIGPVHPDFGDATAPCTEGWSTTQPLIASRAQNMRRSVVRATVNIV